MPFDVPGMADEQSELVVDKWNETIRKTFDRLIKSFGESRFIQLEATSFNNPVRAPMKWFGDSLQPRRCIGDEWTQRLADWGDLGRRSLHHEYCEYVVIHKPDSYGQLRPKRVQVTTEMREYWVSVAIHDPNKLRKMAQEILGQQPSWEELYGTKDPFALNEEEREISFRHTQPDMEMIVHSLRKKCRLIRSATEYRAGVVYEEPYQRVS
ncbi:hypothetical protein [Paenibacillus sp. Soil787]|uniref:hypothetical protein n=1 Tax=Paenibacillus sp. Soil787 TaxID=1736411 RepID=UPI0007025360|nr:hypothetical protein [Paenibacillus sp. Soil787]KRF21755.1 hypothetical protein ASG93_30665 [Paenibacillus sp. Soil787]